MAQKMLKMQKLRGQIIVIDKLNILENETIEQYKKRVCNSKDDYDLTWNEVANIIKLNTGLNITGEACRKYYAYHKEDILKELDESTLDYLNAQKEKVKIRDERTQLNSLVRAIAREETLKEIALEVSSQMSDKKILTPPTPEILQELNDKVEESKIATLVLSDWHYDLEVDVCYQKSEKSYLIQASDLIAGTVRRLYLNNIENGLEFLKRIDFVNYRIFLP